MSIEINLCPLLQKSKSADCKLLRELQNAMPEKLTLLQWEQLNEQMSRTPSEIDPDGVPGAHMHLFALLNQFGFSPMSKQKALRFAKELLEAGWAE